MPISTLILDVDGVMTDGRLYYGPLGEETKVFHARDGQGLALLRKKINVIVISGRDSPALRTRLADLGIITHHLGCEDKLHAAGGLPLEKCAFMGDDFSDLELMRRVGMKMAPRDAIPEIKAIADWVSTLPGGYGCVREACDMLLELEFPAVRAI